MHLATVIVRLHEHHGSKLPRDLERALELAGTALHGRPKSCAASPAASAEGPATPAAPPARPPGTWELPEPEAPREKRKRPASPLLHDDAPPEQEHSPEAVLSPGEAWVAARAERWQEPSRSRSRTRSRSPEPPAPSPSPAPEERASVPASSPTLAGALRSEPPTLPLGEWVEPSLFGLRRRGFSELDLVRGVARAFACPPELLHCFRLRGIMQGDHLTDPLQLIIFLTMALRGFDHWHGQSEDGGYRVRHWMTLGLSLLFGRVPHWGIPSDGA